MRCCLCGNRIEGEEKEKPMVVFYGGKYRAAHRDCRTGFQFQGHRHRRRKTNRRDCNGSICTD
nr:MAG TPA: protein of unknown function DUF1788 [Caudovirales sp. ctNII2]